MVQRHSRPKRRRFSLPNRTSYPNNCWSIGAVHRTRSSSPRQSCNLTLAGWLKLKQLPPAESLWAVNARARFVVDGLNSASFRIKKAPPKAAIATFYVRLVLPRGSFDAWFARTAAKSDRLNSAIFTRQNSITYESKRAIPANITLKE